MIQLKRTFNNNALKFALSHLNCDTQALVLIDYYIVS